MSDTQHRSDPHRLDDLQAHERAKRRVAEVAGRDCAEHIVWDRDHLLQGHVDVGETHLVVIAPRDEQHRTLVLSECEWDALRRGRSVDA